MKPLTLSLALLMCSLCQAQSATTRTWGGSSEQTVVGTYWSVRVLDKDHYEQILSGWRDETEECIAEQWGNPTHFNAVVCNPLIPTEYRPITAMLPATPHKPAYWKQGLVDDLPDQKNVGVMLNFGPNSEGVFKYCHYMNYWKGTQLEEAHFCYSPIPTEYQPVTAMLDYVPGNLYEGVLIVFTDLTQNSGTHSTRPDSKLDFDALNNGFTEGVAGCSVSGYIAYHQIDNNNIEVLTLPENPPCIGIASFSLQYKIAKTEKSFQAHSEWHECTADEMNRYLGVILPLAYCKDANNHIPMCKPDSRPDEVCWEP